LKAHAHAIVLSKVHDRHVAPNGLRVRVLKTSFAGPRNFLAFVKSLTVHQRSQRYDSGMGIRISNRPNFSIISAAGAGLAAWHRNGACGDDGNRRHGDGTLRAPCDDRRYRSRSRSSDESESGRDRDRTHPAYGPFDDVRRGLRRVDEPYARETKSSRAMA